MALALRLLLLLLLAVALPARAAQAAPVQGQGADLDRDFDYLQVLVNDTLKILENAGAEPVGEGGTASQPTFRMEALGDAEGVAAGRTSPAPLLVTARKPSSHRRGPPTGKDKATGHKKPHETSENMRQMLKEMLQAGQEVDGEALLKADFPRGSSGSLAASAAGREAMPRTATGDEAAGKASPLDWLHKVVKPPAGVAAERIFPAPLLILTHKAGSHHRVPTRGKNKGTGKGKPREPNNILNTIAMELQKGHGMDRDALWKAAFPKGREAMPRTVTGDAAGPTTPVPDSPKGWWLGLMAGMLLLVLVFILCCVLIWCYWKIKGSDSASSQDQTKTSAMQTCASHQPSPSQFPTSLPQLQYPLYCWGHAATPHNRNLCPQRCWPWCPARTGGTAQGRA